MLPVDVPADGATSTWGAVHDLASGALGWGLCGFAGLGGLLAVSIVVAERSHLRAALVVVGLVAAGALITIASGHVATRVTYGDGDPPPAAVREGWPAYFRTDQPDTDELRTERFAMAIDTLFWAGLLGFAATPVIIRRRVYRRWWRRAPWRRATRGSAAASRDRG